MGPLSSGRTGLRVLKALSIPVMIATWLSADAFAATTTVTAGADLQAALNAAHPGDVLVLQAGARYVGPFTLPPNPIGPPITIRSSAILPERRIGPQDIALLPTLASPVAWAILDGTGAANWRLDGIAFEPVVDGTGEVILLQDSTNIYMSTRRLPRPAACYRYARSHKATFSRWHVHVRRKRLPNSHCIPAELSFRKHINADLLWYDLILERFRMICGGA